MSREIKFRGKRKDTGRWVYGSLHVSDGRCWICPIGITPKKTGCAAYEYILNPLYEVDPATVGQYTGFKDNNGVEVFDGSLATCFGDRRIIRWSNIMCRFVQDKIIKDYGIINSYHYLDEATAVDLIVIGNIHDNPDLLEGKDNDKN